MKKQGIKYKDSGCCPGHDKFPREAYNTRPSMKAKRRTDRLANKRARQWSKEFLIVDDPILDHIPTVLEVTKMGEYYERVINFKKEQK